MGPTWGPSGADTTWMGPMLAPWNLLSGWLRLIHHETLICIKPYNRNEIVLPIVNCQNELSVTILLPNHRNDFNKIIQHKLVNRRTIQFLTRHFRWMDLGTKSQSINWTLNVYWHSNWLPYFPNNVEFYLFKRNVIVSQIMCNIW